MLKFAYQPHVPSYYAATANDATRHPPLHGAISADVCVIGGGLTGISTALNLAERGYSVVVLEASKIGWGASGRNGGQLIGGFSCGIDTFAQHMPRADVQRVWSMGLESAAMVRDRVQKHGIDCDLTRGFLTVANKARHADELRAWRDEAASRFGYQGYRYVERTELAGFVDSERYVGGLDDADSGHLHPLNYTLGLARAAHEAGVSIYEDTCASSVENVANGHRVTAGLGHVDARYVVLGCNAYLGSLAPRLARKIMPAGTFVIATEPLSEASAQALLPTNAAICDSKFPLDYFRLSKDRRLLWGGKATFSTRMPASLVETMRGDMLKTFPQLAGMKIDYAWGGFVDITMNRAPHFGRIEPTVYFAQGFSGHGVNVTGLAGLLIAEAIDAQAARFDLFARIRHRNFPGGRLFRAPALALAMAWHTMRDAR